MTARNIDPEFIVICQSAWMNAGGFGISYDWDGAKFNNLPDAIKHGWKLRGSDDFNIGQTYGDDLIWFGWMDKQIKEPIETMREIAGTIGLGFNPKLYRLKFSRATGKAQP